MVTIGTLTRDDVPDYHKVMCSAYGGRMPKGLDTVALRDYANVRALFADRRQVCAMRILDHKMYIGGKTVPMGGIAGLGTRDDSRKRGYAGELLKYSLAEMHRLGYALSALFPFSYRFYRPFGWELAGHKVRYTGLRPKDFTPYDEGKLVRRATARDLPAIKRCFKRLAAQYNGVTVRRDSFWKKRLEKARKGNDKLFVIQRNNRVIGWFNLFGGKNKEKIRVLATTEAALLEPAACRAMFGFLAKQRPGRIPMELDAPVFPSLLDYFTDSFVRTRLLPLFQFRLIDLRKALTLRGYPKEAQGRVVFRVRDPNASWNSGTWELAVRNGRGVVKTTARKPDVVIDQSRFAQVYMGNKSLEELVLCNTAKVRSRSVVSLVDSIFGGQRQFFVDEF